MKSLHHSASLSKQFPIPKELEFLDDEDECSECNYLKENLIKFKRELGFYSLKVSSLGGKELDLCQTLQGRDIEGESHRVSNNKLWKEIVNEFEILMDLVEVKG